MWAGILLRWWVSIYKRSWAPKVCKNIVILKWSVVYGIGFLHHFPWKGPGTFPKSDDFERLQKSQATSFSWNIWSNGIGDGYLKWWKPIFEHLTWYFSIGIYMIFISCYLISYPFLHHRNPRFFGDMNIHNEIRATAGCGVPPCLWAWHSDARMGMDPDRSGLDQTLGSTKNY